MDTSLQLSPAMKGAKSPTPELGSWQILQIQGKLDISQAGKQGLHVMSLSQLC